MHWARSTEYYPKFTELRVAAVFALGFLVVTVMLKVAVPISRGEFSRKQNAAVTMNGVPREAIPQVAVH